MPCVTEVVNRSLKADCTDFTIGIFNTIKATFHSTIFDIPMRPVRDNERHQRRFTC